MMWHVLPFAISLVPGYLFSIQFVPRFNNIKACDSRIRIHWNAVVVQGKWKQISRKKNCIRAYCTVLCTVHYNGEQRVFSLLSNRTKLCLSSYAYEWGWNLRIGKCCRCHHVAVTFHYLELTDVICLILEIIGSKERLWQPFIQ